MEYIDLRIAVALKKLLGSVENAEVVRDFLNSILELNSEITSIVFENPYNISDFDNLDDTYNTSVELVLKLADKSKINLGISLISQHVVAEDMFQYSIDKYNSKLLAAGDPKKLNPTMTISINAFHQFDLTDLYHDHFKLKGHEEFMLKALHIITLQNFNKSIEECFSKKDKWIYLLKNSSKIKAKFKFGDKYLDKALSRISKQNIDLQELEKIFELEYHTNKNICKV